MKKLLLLVFAAWFIAAALCVEVPAQAAEGRPPNVLFIVVDDLNDWVGCLGGHPQAQTPNIDRLAAAGTLFTKAHCASGVCNPSRTAVMAGMLPYRTGVYNNFNRFEQSAVARDVDTLAAVFQKGGYRTVGASKVYHGWYDRKAWDRYTHPPIKNPEAQPAGVPAHGIAELAEHDWAALEIPLEKFGDVQSARWVAEEISTAHDRPFFAACGIIRPHVPWYAPKQYYDRFPIESIQLPPLKSDDLADIPPTGQAIAGGSIDDVIQKHGKAREAVQAYLACTSFADDCVGILLDALENGPNRDNTIVILWGDNGFHLGEKRHWSKATLWSESARVPLIIRQPNGMPGQICSRTVSLVDLFPTLVELAGLPPPRQPLDGRSLVPLLEKPWREWDHPAVVTQERGTHAVCDERYSYLRYWNGEEELYDHENDPHEWVNRANDPALVAVKSRLMALLPSPESEAGYAPWDGGRMPNYLRRWKLVAPDTQ